MPQTHLPLLPSARLKKLQRSLNLNEKNDDGKNNVKSSDNDSHQKIIMSSLQKNGTEHNKNDHNNDKVIYNCQDVINILSRNAMDEFPMLEVPTTSASLPTTIHHEEEEEEDVRNLTEDDFNQTRLQQHKLQQQPQFNSSKSIQKDKNTSKSIQEYNQLRNEQLQKLSSLQPLSPSTTSNAVMHFMHTTVKFMNNISSEANEKLIQFEDSIEALEIKISLIEKKLDSTSCIDHDILKMTGH